MYLKQITIRKTKKYFVIIQYSANKTNALLEIFIVHKLEKRKELNIIEKDLL